MDRDRYQHQMINFLKDEFDLDEGAIAIAIKRWGREGDPLHMILWQYRLITLEQLNCIFDWLRDQTLNLNPFHLFLENNDHV